MANTGPTPSTVPGDAPLTEDKFYADRLSFWGNVTGATMKVAASVIFFCAWLWWCAFAGFGLLHIIVLPIIVAALFILL
jgi:hypothetical protein